MKDFNNTQRIAMLEDAVAALAEHVHTLQSDNIALRAQLAEAPRRGAKERDYGPKSQRAMDERMALRILVGRYRDWSVRKIADECGLSRGQVYSLKGGYTFTDVHRTADKIRERRAQRA